MLPTFLSVTICMRDILILLVRFSALYIIHFHPCRTAEFTMKYRALVVLPTLLWPFMMTNSFLYRKYLSSSSLPVSRPFSMRPWLKSSIHWKSSSVSTRKLRSPSSIRIFRSASSSCCTMSRMGRVLPCSMPSRIAAKADCMSSMSLLFISLDRTRMTSSSSILLAAMYPPQSVAALISTLCFSPCDALRTIRAAILSLS